MFWLVITSPCKPVGIITNTVSYTKEYDSKGVCMLIIRLPFVNRPRQVFKTYIQMSSQKIIDDSGWVEYEKKWTCGLITDPLDKMRICIDHKFAKFTTRQHYLDNLRCNALWYRKNDRI